jgi:hypothetical protein
MQFHSYSYSSMCLCRLINVHLSAKTLSGSLVLVIRYFTANNAGRERRRKCGRRQSQRISAPILLDNDVIERPTDLYTDTEMLINTDSRTASEDPELPMISFDYYVNNVCDE